MTESEQKNVPRIVLPAYVVGVTGHRDLDAGEVDHLKEQVEQLFLAMVGRGLPGGIEMPKEWQPLKNTPIVVLSALAPGADTLVAEVALKLRNDKDHPMDIEVRAPLPFPHEVYPRSTTFQGSGLADDAADAYDRVTQSILTGVPRERWQEHVWPVLLAEDKEKEELPSNDEYLRQAANTDQENTTLRHRRYAATGEYVAQHCNLLIAIWDDASNRLGEGGTADTVEGKLQGFVPGHLPKNPSFTWIPTGAVLHLPCHRGIRTENAPPTKTTGWRWLYPGDLKEKTVATTDSAHRNDGHARQAQYARRMVEDAAHLTDFNTNADPRRSWLQLEKVDMDSCLKKEAGELAKMLKGPEGAQDQVRKCLHPDAWASLDVLARVRRRAGTGADKLTEKTGTVTLAMFALAFLFTCLLHLWAHLGFLSVASEQRLMFIFLACYLLGVVVYAGYSWRGIEPRNHDWRVLAEGLRVQIFWAVAGLESSVAASYMQRQREELDWIRKAISSLAAPYHRWKHWFNTLSLDSKITVLEAIHRNWLGEQARYFDKQWKKNDHAAHFWHEIASVFIPAGVMLCFLTELLRDMPGLRTREWLGEEPCHVGGLLAASAASLILAAAIFSVWTAHKREQHDYAGSSLAARLGPYLMRAMIALFIAIGTILGCEVALFASVAEEHQHQPPLNEWSVVGVGTLLLIGALAVAWRETKFFSELSRQYHAMTALFTTAGERMQRHLQTLKDAAEEDAAKTEIRRIQEMLEMLGKEALNENAEWLILHRARPLEPVHG